MSDMKQESAEGCQKLVKFGDKHATAGEGIEEAKWVVPVSPSIGFDFLRPRFWRRTGDGRLSLQRERGQSELEPVVSPDAPLLQDAGRRGEPSEIPSAQARDSPVRSIFGSIQPECLVPLLGGNGHLTGVVVLGTRLSEEPYSRQGKRLPASVANQAGIALESIRRGEEIAERIETERRVAQVMKFAKQVQARLFPQKLPPLKTLEYTGGCIQARQVGGDYYQDRGYALYPSRNDCFADWCFDLDHVAYR